MNIFTFCKSSLPPPSSPSAPAVPMTDAAAPAIRPSSPHTMMMLAKTIDSTPNTFGARASCSGGPAGATYGCTRSATGA
jgi:hypothetical protein